MPYTLLKLVMVAVPNFLGGSMENYGLITYHEAELLHDDLRSAAENTQRVGHVYILRYGQNINVSYNFYLIDLLFMSAFACCHTRSWAVMVWNIVQMWVCCKFRIVNAFSTDDLLPCNGNVNIPSLSSLNVSSIVAWRLANLLGHVVPFCHTGCLDLLFSLAAATF
nr:aminopeptidase M1-like isoform X2 [Tanacetum cinerariifolium]